VSFERIFVLGAGAIGSSYGALLSGKNDVTLIGKKDHVDAINAHGLEIKGDIEWKFSIKAAVQVKEIPLGSLILFTTKAQDIAEAVNRLKQLLKKGITILALQNGLGIKELILRSVGTQIDVVRGLSLMGAEFIEPGRISLWNGSTIIEQTSAGEEIAALFRESGIETALTGDIEKEEWNKLVVNCVVNPLTAVLKIRNNAIGSDILKEIRHAVIEECVQVGKAEGVTFKSGLKSDIDHGIKGYQNYSSMCQDIMKGKKTEIDFLNGKIVELGNKHGISTPVNETLVGLIKFLEVMK
jgi:2-dehydropantoate 2-reductase